MRFYSLIIPVYNRAVEVDELLYSLTQQTYRNFEVLIVEDGSQHPCKMVVDKYNSKLTISYYFKENAGQGLARNYGFEKANGDYFIVFDSDCLIPHNYLDVVDKAIENHNWDAFGGPDKEHESFTLIKKAISYSMTSPFNTGGIRLPRTAKAQSTFGKNVGWKGIKPGDLVFFKFKQKGEKWWHSGVITVVDKKKIRFIHASSSRGVVESNLLSDYYKKNVKGFRRVI